MNGRRSAKPSKTLDPLKIFLHAGAFHKSYDLLCKSVVPQEEGALPDDRLVGVISHPTMVLSVFASELYLKCLLCLESDEVPNEHNLKKLFETLPVATRREVDDLWDADIRHPAKQKVLDKLRATPAGKDIRLDLRYAIDKGANAFIELRYFYEKEQSFFLLADLPFLLRSIILKRCPSWGAIYPKPSGLVR
jgi:hypothetical protein